LGLLAIALGALSAVRRSTRPIEVEVDRVRGVIRVRRRFGTEPLEVPIDAVKELAVEQSSTPAGIPWDPTRRIATGRLLLCLRNGKEVPIDADFRAPLRAHEDAMHRLHAELTATPLDP
jgi:hypothetical protein